MSPALLKYKRSGTMNQYEVTATAVTINAGMIKLSQSQANRRKHLLKRVTDDVYEVISSVQFKRGEVIGYDGAVNKALLLEITPVGNVQLVTEQIVEKINPFRKRKE